MGAETCRRLAPGRGVQRRAPSRQKLSGGISSVCFTDGRKGGGHGWNPKSQENMVQRRQRLRPVPARDFLVLPRPPDAGEPGHRTRGNWIANNSG